MGRKQIKIGQNVLEHCFTFVNDLALAENSKRKGDEDFSF